MTGHTDDGLWVAATQGGYFTTAQALRTGYGARRIAAGLADGTLVRVLGDLLRVVAFPAGPFDEYARWCAWFEGRAVVSAHSAADLYGIGSLASRFVHLTVSGRRRPQLPRLAVQRGRLPAADLQWLGPVQVTTPLRTVLDLAAAAIRQPDLDEVVGDALTLGRLTLAELRGALPAVPDPIAGRLAHAIRA